MQALVDIHQLLGDIYVFILAYVMWQVFDIYNCIIFMLSTVLDNRKELVVFIFSRFGTFIMTLHNETKDRISEQTLGMWKFHANVKIDFPFCSSFMNFHQP